MLISIFFSQSMEGKYNYFSDCKHLLLLYIMELTLLSMCTYLFFFFLNLKDSFCSCFISPTHCSEKRVESVNVFKLWSEGCVQRHSNSMWPEMFTVNPLWCMFSNVGWQEAVAFHPPPPLLPPQQHVTREAFTVSQMCHLSQMLFYGIVLKRDVCLVCNCFIFFMFVKNWKIPLHILFTKRKHER